MRHAGVSSDSASRFLSLLRAAGIPSTIAGLPTAAVTDNVSFIGRFDHTPFDPTTLGPAKTTWGLAAYGKLSRSGALSTAPTATQSHGGKSGQDIGSLQAQYSTFFGNDYLAGGPNDDVLVTTPAAFANSRVSTFALRLASRRSDRPPQTPNSAGESAGAEVRRPSGKKDRAASA